LSKRSPGFALCLVAESTTGAFVSAEYTASPQELPEDVGEIAVKMLLEEILQVYYSKSAYIKFATIRKKPIIFEMLGRLCGCDESEYDAILDGALARGCI